MLLTPRAKLLVLALIASVAAFVAAPALADSVTPTPVALPAPAIPDVPAFPGPIAPPAKAAPQMGILTTSPDTAVSNSNVTISGSNLPANKAVMLTWSTANVTWLASPRPDAVDYMGRQATNLTTVLGTATTDASGSFKTTVTVPRDWGGIHDIYAVIDGLQVAKGGLLVARSASMSPRKGPIGTMITITYSGLGSYLYGGGGSVSWDNHFTGEFMSYWTRGTAILHIRAAGPVGKHTIEIASGIDIKYMNVQQSPNPWHKGFVFTFTTTKDNGRPKPEIDWPAQVTPTLDAKTTMQLNTPTSGTASLAQTSGPVNSSVALTASGLKAGAPVDLEWASVVGNRVNCSGTCWSFITVPVAAATADANGNLSQKITVPDGLGGWHVLQLLQDGKIVAQTPYYVLRSIVGKGVSSLVLHEGQPFTLHLKGLGWTQLDNTIAVDYDNSYIGYGCGFNSQGDVVMNFVATGGPGTHLIDMYPLLYTLQPTYLNTHWGMEPVLSYDRDIPGLALGYNLPAIRLAITIDK